MVVRHGAVVCLEPLKELISSVSGDDLRYRSALCMCQHSTLEANRSVNFVSPVFHLAWLDRQMNRKMADSRVTQVFQIPSPAYIERAKLASQFVHGKIRVTRMVI